MKRLTILRHAKSDWAEGVDDFDRQLNARGERAARRIGTELKSRKLGFDLVLASTARRVRDTLARVTEETGDLPIHYDDDLYLASERELLERVRAISGPVSSLMLVGHNPGLERLIVDLAADDERGLRNRIIGGLPTAAVAMLELPIDRWVDANRGEAEFVDLILPRELD